MKYSELAQHGGTGSDVMGETDASVDNGPAQVHGDRLFLFAIGAIVAFSAYLLNSIVA